MTADKRMEASFARSCEMRPAFLRYPSDSSIFGTSGAIPLATRETWLSISSV